MLTYVDLYTKDGEKIFEKLEVIEQRVFDAFREKGIKVAEDNSGVFINKRPIAVIFEVIQAFCNPEIQWPGVYLDFAVPQELCDVKESYDVVHVVKHTDTIWSLYFPNSIVLETTLLELLPSL